MTRLAAFLTAAALVLSIGRAGADWGGQRFKLVPDDGVADDRFGGSVAISGDTAIIGACRRGDPHGSSVSGSAYLFRVSTGRQIARLRPEDQVQGDRFGYSVAICDKKAIVGAYRHEHKGIKCGAAYVFDTVTGEQLRILLPLDGAVGDRFGFSVAISGSIAIVGAYQDDDHGEGSGSAYVFDISTGRQIAKLIARDGAEGDHFGITVGIDGDTAIVGSYLEDHHGRDSGSAYLFEASTGRPVSKLRPDDGRTRDYFGRSVAISSTIAIVGAWGDRDNGLESGSAYIFDTRTGRQIAKLLALDGSAGDRFGSAVAVIGSTAIVGAWGNDDRGADSGSAYIFDIESGLQITKLLATDGRERDAFGGSVALSGEMALVGAGGVDGDAGVDSGAAYLIELRGVRSGSP